MTMRGWVCQKKSMMVTLWGVGLLAVGIIGCATTGTVGSNCQTEFQKLMTKAETDYCSPILYNHFEGQVTEWRGRCGEKDLRQKKDMVEKLRSAQICSENARRQEMLFANCAFRIKKLKEGLSCIGDDCASAQTEMSEIASECDVPLMKGKLKDEIAGLKGMLDERTTAGPALKSLQKLMMTCDDVYDIRNRKQAQAGFNRIVKAVSRTKEMETRHPEGSVLSQFQKGAQESCGFALTEVMKKITAVSDRDIERISKTSRRKKRHIKRYNRYGEKLAQINAQGLFPQVLEPLKMVLERFGSEYNMPIPKKRRAPKPSQVAEPKSNRAPETELADKAPPETAPKKKVPVSDDEKKKAEANLKGMGEKPPV